jgi:hypothetical protein
MMTVSTLRGEDGGEIRLHLKTFSDGQVRASLAITQDCGNSTLEELIDGGMTMFQSRESALEWAHSRAADQGFRRIKIEESAG